MKVEINDPIYGKLSWEAPPELLKFVDENRLDPQKFNKFFRMFLQALMMSQTINGELGQKADKMLHIGLRALQLSVSELVKIEEGEKPYPLANAVDHI